MARPKPRTLPLLPAPEKKVYLRTIEMKICVFRTNAENNKSTEKKQHFTSILCFVLLHFALFFNLFSMPGKKRKETFYCSAETVSILIFVIVPSRMCTSIIVFGSLLVRAHAKVSVSRALLRSLCQVNYVKILDNYPTHYRN